MDFRKLSKAFPPPTASTNGTDRLNMTELSPNILEALVPGYSLISRYLFVTFGVDISVFVIVAVAIFAIMKGGGYISKVLESTFRFLFVSSIYIDEHDDLFDMVMGWVAAHQAITSNNRRMRAKTQRGSSADDAYDASADDALGENGLFDYNKWSARTPPRFEPHYGRQFIWHNGRVFFFSRQMQSSQGQRIQVSFNNAKDDDIIQLDCIGRDILPLKDLLRTIRVWSLNRLRHTTTIRHPTPKDRARWGGTWSKTSSRPSRPMDTVILDAEQKSMIIKDMNEYLHPASPKWYATRGIPYRRGYLFHGPPGTGKTSLSFALAGIFGLEIYAISLQEPTLTEGDLMQLFNGLPRRCIVLLEDVDAAGLVRDGSSEDDEGSNRRKKGEKDNTCSRKDVKNDEKEGSGKLKKDEEYTLKDLARELKSVAPQQSRRGGTDNVKANSNNQSGTGISLSGLLNAIDGVATHEGRVLIMTTNHPEKLDAALIRPGRVDCKVDFRLAMKVQVRELFIRMYAASEDGPLSGGAIGVEVYARGHSKGLETRASDVPISRIRLEELATEFSAHVPDNTFTPAELQNLLMRNKGDPQAAVNGLDDWMRLTLEEKEQRGQDMDEGWLGTSQSAISGSSDTLVIDM